MSQSTEIPETAVDTVAVPNQNSLIYLPLEKVATSFRLLIIRPKSASSLLKCDLVYDHWDHPQCAYEALSYTWGQSYRWCDNNTSYEISVNNQKFVVAHNLFCALQELRREDQPRVVWVDAICINQADDEERSRQVENMASVYAKAERVVVWLGEQAENSDYAMDLLGRILAAMDLLLPADQPSKDWLIRCKERPCIHREAVDEVVNHKYALGWIALDNLISRSWWSRSWIVQEVALAQDIHVMCGGKSAPWKAIWYMAFLSIHSQGAINSMILSSEFSDWTVRRWANRKDGYLLELVDLCLNRSATIGGLERTLIMSLEANRERICLNPRDKVYSLLGLLKDEEKLSIKVDYSKSYFQVYCDVVEHYIQRTGKLDFLCHSQHGGLTLDEPSWIPNWSNPQRNEPFGDSYDPKFCASGNMKAQWQISREMLTLKVSGFRISVVDRACFEGVQKNEEVWQMAMWAFEKDITTSDDDESPYMAVLKTVLAGGSHYPQVESIPDGTSRQYLTEEFGIDLRGFLAGRTVFTTESSMLGLASDLTYTGDLICVLLGCTVPVVLIHLQENEYRLLGDCYLHNDTMVGAAIKDLEDGKYTLEEFTLL